MSVPVFPIRDHVAAADKMISELLLICPDPNQADFEEREDEYRANVGARSMLMEAQDMIEIGILARQIKARSDAEKQNPESPGSSVSSALRVGEETAARRLISQFVMAYYRE